MIIKYNEYIKESSNNSQFFKTYKETENWLELMDIEHYTINQDLTVDVNSTVDISDKNLTHIPVKFGIVYGNFYCYDNELTSLIGSPKEVEDCYSCYGNKLTSLIGSPEIVKGFFYNDIDLTSLEGLSIFNLKKIIRRGWYIGVNDDYKRRLF